MAQSLKLTACTVDLDLREVHGFGEVRTLTPTEAALLSWLAARPGEPSSREDLLTEVWGYAKGVDSATVFNTVRRLRTKIEVDPGNPDHILTVRGLGYRLVCAPASSTLLGRSRDVLRLEGLLAEGRLVTVIGPGGMGKTRLAREVLARHAGPGWFCDLSEVQDATEVAAAVMAATASGDEAALDRPRALLVLDNLEQALDGSAQVVRRWLDSLPDLRVLTTSREALALDGEQVVVLGPLDAEDAAVLFRKRAQAVDPSFQAEDVVVEAIVSRLDGIPLALELAAGRVRVLAADDLLRRLDDQLAVLRGRRRDRPARHATLEAVADGSWALLAPDEQRAFARCAVFHGGFDLLAAEAVLGSAALDLVDALVARSLLWVDRAGSAPRFRAYGVLRAYARARLAASADAESALQAHAQHYAHFDWGDQVPIAEVDNCMAAARHGVGDDAARLVLAAKTHLRERFQLDAVLPLFERALGEVVEPELRAMLLCARGDMLVLGGRLDEGRLDLDAAFALAEAGGLVRTGALVWAGRGVIARVEGRNDDAIAAYERALSLLDPKAERRVVGSLYGRMALTWADLGDRERGMAYLDRALEVHRATGNALNEANVMVNRIDLRATASDTDLAELDAALALAERAGSFRVMANALWQRSRVYAARGDAEAAGRALERVERFDALVGRSRRPGFRGEDPRPRN